MVQRRRQRKTDDPRFRLSRARNGGRTRARRYSRLWQGLMMYYLTDKRTGRTATASFKSWLVERGLDRIAAEAKQ